MEPVTARERPPVEARERLERARDRKAERMPRKDELSQEIVRRRALPACVEAFEDLLAHDPSLDVDRVEDRLSAHLAQELEHGRQRVGRHGHGEHAVIGVGCRVADSVAPTLSRTRAAARVPSHGLRASDAVACARESALMPLSFEDSRNASRPCRCTVTAATCVLAASARGRSRGPPGRDGCSRRAALGSSGIRRMACSVCRPIAGLALFGEVRESILSLAPAARRADRRRNA